MGVEAETDRPILDGLPLLQKTRSLFLKLTIRVTKNLWIDILILSILIKIIFLR